MARVTKRRALLVLTALGLGMAAGVAATAAAMTVTEGRQALGQFVLSPGFGGASAVVAAALAYRGASRGLAAQQAADRKHQWWERARWALELTIDTSSSTRTVGCSMLEALADSGNEYADQHETGLIDAAMRATLVRGGKRDGPGPHWVEEPSAPEEGPP